MKLSVVRSVLDACLFQSVEELQSCWHWIVNKADVNFGSLNLTLAHYRLQPADVGADDRSLQPSTTSSESPNAHLPSGYLQRPEGPNGTLFLNYVFLWYPQFLVLNYCLRCSLVSATTV